MPAALRHPTARYLAALVTVLCYPGAEAADTYAGGTLSVPTLGIGSATYTDVVLSGGKVLRGPNQSSPNNSQDTWDPVTQRLLVPSVRIGVNTLNNVVATDLQLVSIGSVSNADTYDGSQLTIGSVLAGGTIYNHVVVRPGAIIGVGGGLPQATRDVYSNGQLTIAAVAVGAKVYTNVVITVKEIVSVGGIARAATFFDAPVAGLCYGTTPSLTATAMPTSASGQFLYVPGDLVTFWIDGSGGGCTGSTANSPASVGLGAVLPSGSLTSVVALGPGLQAADTLTALNTGTTGLFNLSGLSLNPSDIGNLDNFLGSEGASLPQLPSGPQGVDGFFYTVQADTSLATGGAPPFVTPVASSTATATSQLQDTVTSGLIAAAGALPNQPASYSIPSNGQLKFSLAINQYLTPLSGAAGAEYANETASFVWFDGAGNTVQVSNAGTAPITVANLAAHLLTGTYSISGRTVTKTLSGTVISSGSFNGDTFQQVQTLDARYVDSTSEIFTGAYARTYTDGTDNGQLFNYGNQVVNSVILTPLTLAMLAGHSVTINNSCGEGVANVLTFTGNGAPLNSVTLNQSCGGLPLTLVPATGLPGILLATDTSGFIAYVGLYGSGLAPGAEFVLVEEAEGSQGSSGNGSTSQWSYGGPIASVD